MQPLQKQANSQYFGDSSLHDKEMRIVDIQLNRAKKILDTIVLNIWAIYEILVFSTNDNLIIEKNTLNLLILIKSQMAIPVLLL